MVDGMVIPCEAQSDTEFFHAWSSDQQSCTKGAVGQNEIRKISGLALQCYLANNFAERINCFITDTDEVGALQ